MSFYFAGGTLHLDAPSYIQRRADQILYESLRRGEFCYVLTSRQMGKSSLMVRTARLLKEAGATVALLDLTQIGQNVTEEQWYDGLLSSVGEQLQLEDEIEAHWAANTRLSPFQRWMRAIREVVLARCEGQVVIFVDEIDMVRALKFSTDEFFAGIREFYNRRSHDPEFERLTFCLLGVASPPDLIQDTRTTPFNIGRRIELTDFTEEEAAPLAQGFRRSDREEQALLRRVLHWTGGHPFLTQRLCLAVAKDSSAKSARDVDQLCADLFFYKRAREQDSNLLFVRERLLKSEVDLAGLLEMYKRVRSRRHKVPDSDSDPLVTVLRLSGVARVDHGHLAVRNRIYDHVFDDEWVKSSMPDAERRRQRAAYRRGLFRAAAIASIVLLIISGLALVAIVQRRRAEAQERWNRQLLYVAQMNLAQQEWERGNVARVLELLEAQRPQPAKEDLRGFEWYYLWRLCHSELAALRHDGRVASVAFSPDGRTLAVGSEDQSVRLWDVASRREVFALKGHTGKINGVAFSLDGKTLATGSEDRAAKLWDATSGRELATLTGHQNAVNGVAFSPDGRGLATGSADGTVKLWKVPGGEEALTLHDHTGDVHAVAFSPDDKLLATGSGKALKLWDVTTGQELFTSKVKAGEVNAVAFSPDGATLAAAIYDGVTLWGVSRRREISALKGHASVVTTVAFSPDGETLVTGSQDSTVKLWEVSTGRELSSFRGHTEAVGSVAVSPDGQIVASGSHDLTVRLWERTAQQGQPVLLKGHTNVIRSVAFSPDGRTIATGSNDMTAKLWDAAGGRELATLKGHKDAVNMVVFSPDGRTLATGSGSGAGSEEGTVKLWDAASGRELATLDVTLDSERYEKTVAIAFSPDGRMLATGSDHPTVKLWDVASGRELATLKGHTGRITAVAFSGDGTTLATGSDMDVKLWNAANGKELTASKEHERLIHAVTRYPGIQPGSSFSVGIADFEPERYQVGGPEGPDWPMLGRTSVSRSRGWHKFEIKIDRAGCQIFIDDTRVASATGDFRFDEVRLVASAPHWRPDATYYFDDFCFTPLDTDQRYCDGFEDRTLDPFWTAEQMYGTISLSPDQNRSGAQALRLSSMSGGHKWMTLKHRLANATKGTVSVWFYDTAPGAETLYSHVTVTDNRLKYSYTALSPDGQILATSSYGDKAVKLWDMTTRQEIAPLNGHAGQVYCLTFSPDGRRLATGSEDRTVKLWDVATWREVATLKGHTDAVTSLWFSPDGSILAAVSADYAIRLYRTAAKE